MYSFAYGDLLLATGELLEPLPLEDLTYVEGFLGVLPDRVGPVELPGLVAPSLVDSTDDVTVTEGADHVALQVEN